MRDKRIIFNAKFTLTGFFNALEIGVIEKACANSKQTTGHPSSQFVFAVYIYCLYFDDYIHDFERARYIIRLCKEIRHSIHEYSVEIQGRNKLHKTILLYLLV